VYEVYPRRDYSNVVDVREYVLHDKVNQFVWELQQKHISLLKSEREKVLVELSDTDGFIDDIHRKANLIHEYRFRQGVLDNDKNVMELVKDLETIMGKPYYQQMEYDDGSNNNSSGISNDSDDNVQK
jgi:hypothetical protein